MTDDQINVAIAECCGWTRRTDPSLDWHEPVDYWLNPSGDEVFCPSYCTDLNAMHEAEKTLTESQWGVYIILLATITEGKSVHAAAHQRAEAFLKVRGLWREAPEFGCQNIATKG